MGDVVGFPRAINEAKRRAELWAGIVRFMEANGKSKIEIGFNDAREISAIMSAIADEQAK